MARRIASHRLIETLHGGEHIAGKPPPLVGRVVQLATGFHPLSHNLFCLVGFLQAAVADHAAADRQNRVYRRRVVTHGDDVQIGSRTRADVANPRY
jgi:hypothetical protein